MSKMSYWIKENPSIDGVDVKRKGCTLLDHHCGVASKCMHNTMFVIVLQLLQLENLLYIAINIHSMCRLVGGGGGGGWYFRYSVLNHPLHPFALLQPLL